MKSLLKLPVLIWIFISLLIYSSVLMSPLVFKYSGLISFAIPIVIVLNLIFLLVSIVFKSKFGWVALLLIACGWPFISVGLAINGNDNLEEDGIKVMNYNVKWFTGAKENNYEDVIDWIGSVDADIICFQEFYPNKDIAKRIKERGDYYLSMTENRSNVAIFSKYPVLNDGLLLGNTSLNNIRFADLLIEKDTIRIYAVHLESMGIDPEKIQDREGIQNEYDNVKSKFLNASVSRTEQINTLIQHVEQTEYPFIIAGDFNDVPFSYNYFEFRKRFLNAFEEEGNGLGVTFNQSIPYLRIDNQFFSKKFNVQAFKTVDNIYFSDHFPQIGIYKLTR